MKKPTPIPFAALPLHRAAIGAAVWLLPPWAAAAALLDTTVNPGAYQIRTYVQTATVAVSATNSGNPGAALQELFTVPGPATATDRTYTYLVNSSFVHDPTVDGPVGRISFSIDKSVNFNPSNVAWGNGQGFLLEQGGWLYETDVPLQAVQGVFLTAATTVFSPSNFYRLVDLATHLADNDSHPDFNGGPMRFGFYNGAGVPPGAPNLEIRYVFDNFSVTVSEVPEPSSAALWLAGLALGLARLRAPSRQRAAAA